MAIIDVFNGDADGICALHQLRLANPVESTLVTGVKRDISLLRKVDAKAGDEITTLDISLDKNREPLLALLEAGANIRYFDHHFAGEIPEHDGLDAHINTASDVCTGLLVNGYLGGKHLPWAVVAAFGDNLFESAKTVAKPLSYNDQQLEQLKALGTYLNYNGYGASLDDLYYPPADLYKRVQSYIDPFEFINESPAFTVLEEGFESDMKNADSVKPENENTKFAIYVLPNDKWSRRVSGVYANKLAQQNPDRAHAILSLQEDDTYVVSVRAPLSNKVGADDVCRQFETGGGRKAAAGINKLPGSDIDRFAAVMGEVF